jgi:hypothetical protein
MAEMLEGTAIQRRPSMTRRSAIFANLLLSLPVVTGLLGTAPIASAQSELTATVPFAFSVGNQHMAAGSYSIQQISSCFLAVRNNKTSKTTVLMVRKEEGRKLQSSSHLIFERDGRGTYLTQAWFAGSSEHDQTVAKPKHDPEYVKATLAGSSIEVALK